MTTATSRFATIVFAAFIALFAARAMAAADQTGHVTLNVTVGKGGQVLDAKIQEEEPSGWGFGDAALKSVHQWEFKTTKPGLYTVTIKFKLDAPDEKPAPSALPPHAKP